MRIAGRVVLRCLTIFVCFGIGCEVVRADSWLPAETKTYVSANSQFRLTVVPRDLDGPLEYFEAKVKGETLPEPLGPVGSVEKLVDGEWVLVWSRNLVNEVAPVNALVSDDGSRVVTFDNWHSVGYGDNVVVIYGNDGGLLKSMALNQIVPSYFVDGFKRTVSSIWWEASDPKIVGNTLELYFSGPPEDRKLTFPVRIELEDGTVVPIAEDLHATLKPDFCKAHRAEVASSNEWLRFERNDLFAPSPTELDDWAWKRYVSEAMERLKPDEKLQYEDGWSEEVDFELLLPGEYMEKDFRDDFRDALLAPSADLKRRWFFSEDQELMTREIEKTAKKIKPAQLSGTDMRFFVDDVHWPRIQKALLSSGATLTQIDTEKPIPQTSRRLASLPPDKHVDAACTG